MRTLVTCSMLFGLCVSSLGTAQTPTPQPPAQTKEEEKNNADTGTAPASDTAKDKPSTTATSSSDAQSKPAGKPVREAEKAKTTADETDTLGKPPA